jgi:hypothetical protein
LHHSADWYSTGVSVTCGNTGTSLDGAISLVSRTVDLWQDAPEEQHPNTMWTMWDHEGALVLQPSVAGISPNERVLQGRSRYQQ